MRRYSDENVNFIYKLSIFHDICARADVPQEAKSMAFPTMLKGLALDYCYSNWGMNGSLSFNEICYATRSYFEGAEYIRDILMK